MEKAKLNKIFSKAFDLQEWFVVLTEVFGAKQLLTQPKQILLNSNDKAKSATELGSFATTDDRIIGLYHVVVNDDIWLERNKVGLRELLRDIYRYDVDGALVVFEQGEKWRLSFISEIKVLNEEGEVVEQATEPKRYTYLLGVDEKVKTPSDRLSKLAGKTLALNDILNAFSVEALNEEFYKIISEYFYQLVGGKVGLGKAAKAYEPKLKLPTPIEKHRTYQEFVVRLIGRTIFCWFLKMKKSDDGISLVPEGLLSSDAVKNNKGYYHNILERLFFQTLNTKMDERVDGLPTGCEKIPFLNGGLFEPNSDDYYKPNRVTGISENLNTLIIEDNWFFELFTELEKYNFTIDENSVTDVEVSVDPEMLGRIFENLLAEIDPDSGETARKATGSFYTPREIVDYMATESLVQYIHNKTSISPDKIRPVFKMTEEPDPTFTKTELEGILDALDKAKILDPACGSGAFPMGILQKIVQALQKLDANADWWKKRQVERISNPIVRKALKEKLDSSGVEYARKIGVIQNSLYGVDIQPIAAEISKLRCFLTLIVDENIDETKPNRGIEPLPNLEFKFVTADTLQKLPEEKDLGGLFNSNSDLAQLAQIRQDYLQSYGEQKTELKTQFNTTQDKIAKQQLGFGAALDVKSRAWLISTWNPFSHDKADWFDPQWMFGIDNFDVVIGNPPYLRVQGIDPTIKKKYAATYESAKGAYDLYILFTERGHQLLSENGILNFIQPDKWINGSLGKGLRKITAPHIYKLISFKHYQVFNASTYSSLLWITKKKQEKGTYTELDKDLLSNTHLQNWLNELTCDDFTIIDIKNLNENAWFFTKRNAAIILNKLNKHKRKTSDVFERIFTGLQTSLDEVYFLSKCEVSGKYIKGYSQALDKIITIEDGLVKPLLKGDSIKRYGILQTDTYVIFPYEISIDNQKEKATPLLPDFLKKDYPRGWSYLIECEDMIKNREHGKIKTDKDWYKYLYPKNLTLFNKERLLCPYISSKSQFAYDKYGDFHANTKVYGLIKKSQNKDSYLYLLSILNSSINWFYMTNVSAVFRGGYYVYTPIYLNDFPIPVADRTQQATISILVNYIYLLKSLNELNQVNNHVPNSHLVQLFEEVIDALVYELYFEEDFKKAGIEFMKYAQRDFKGTEGKAEKDAVEIIHQAYQTLREKNNEIRQNLKLMDTRLADLIMPIKTAK